MIDLKALFEACEALIEADRDEFENDDSFLGPYVKRIQEIVCPAPRSTQMIEQLD